MLGSLLSYPGDVIYLVYETGLRAERPVLMATMRLHIETVPKTAAGRDVLETVSSIGNWCGIDVDGYQDLIKQAIADPWATALSNVPTAPTPRSSIKSLPVPWR